MVVQLQALEIFCQPFCLFLLLLLFFMNQINSLNGSEFHSVISLYTKSIHHYHLTNTSCIANSCLRASSSLSYCCTNNCVQESVRIQYYYKSAISPQDLVAHFGLAHWKHTSFEKQILMLISTGAIVKCIIITKCSEKENF